MLKKENRLTSFRQSESRNVPTPLFNLKISKNNSEFSRFGFVISKKVSSSAVVRNSAKRKIRSIIEENLSHVPAGFDLAFYLKKEIISAERLSVGVELIKIMKKESLYV